MKAVAVFQIYLPFFLPQTPEWSELEYLQFEFGVDGRVVKVHPRKANELLFPRPADLKISHLNLDVKSDFIVPQDAPTKISVRDRCFDRIEIQVSGEVASREDCTTEEVIRDYLQQALIACNDFLHH